MTEIDGPNDDPRAAQPTPVEDSRMRRGPPNTEKTPPAPCSSVVVVSRVKGSRPQLFASTCG